MWYYLDYCIFMTLIPSDVSDIFALFQTYYVFIYDMIADFIYIILLYLIVSIGVQGGSG